MYSAVSLYLILKIVFCFMIDEYALFIIHMLQVVCDGINCLVKIIFMNKSTAVSLLEGMEYHVLVVIVTSLRSHRCLFVACAT